MQAVAHLAVYVAKGTFLQLSQGNLSADSCGLLALCLTGTCLSGRWVKLLVSRNPGTSIRRTIAVIFDAVPCYAHYPCCTHGMYGRKARSVQHHARRQQLALLMYADMNKSARSSYISARRSRS